LITITVNISAKEINLFGKDSTDSIRFHEKEEIEELQDIIDTIKWMQNKGKRFKSEGLNLEEEQKRRYKERRKEFLENEDIYLWKNNIRKFYSREIKVG
jgi:hypothetical protein